VSRIVVLGSGIVGRAAAWDLVRRGHEVVVADIDAARAAEVADEIGAVDHQAANAGRPGDLGPLLAGASLLVTAVPFHLNAGLARAAVDAGCHYVDFGGNPAVVAEQLLLDEAARRTGVLLVPDCGLAPGLANVLALDCLRSLGPGPVERLALRVGALPARPHGTLGYQLAFSPAGLINEYAEPCEVLRHGRHTTVDPLTEIEVVDWPGVGTLEAFHTAGGSSSLPRRLEGKVEELDYKTLRYPGHAAAFRAMAEVGLFDPETRTVGSAALAPRDLLADLLAANLPPPGDDLVLVRVWAEALRHGERKTSGAELTDHHDGRFSALARTTAFPAAALAHMLATGAIDEPGARTMEAAIEAGPLLQELDGSGIEVEPWP
jgi:lysine 6-dehydrogenase